MEIKDKIIITMDGLEATQGDGDNWNQEEMVDVAIGLIASSSSSPLTVTVTLIDHW